ncbi:MAG: hypothetical protein V1782_09195 [Pseudomonadota bacterium]
MARNPAQNKVHYEQSELATELADKIGDGIQIIPWHMPYSLVRYDRDGRIIKEGRPKSDFELAERIAKDEDPRLIPGQ